MDEVPQITPEAIMAIPEFDGPWPDDFADNLLFIERKFHPESHTSDAQVKLLHIATGAVRLLYRSERIQTALWIRGSGGIILFEHTDSVSTDVFVSLSPCSDSTPSFTHFARLPGKVDGLGAIMLTESTALLTFSALSSGSRDSELFDASTAPQSWSSGRVYDNLPVRAGDSWVKSEKLAVFCVHLNFSSLVPEVGPAFNILQGLDQEYKPYGSIHLTKQGLAVVAGPHHPSVSENSLSTVYSITISAILQGDHHDLEPLHAAEYMGFSNCPRIHNDDSSIAFLQKRTSWLEDEASLLVVCHGPRKSRSFRQYEFYRDAARTVLLSPLNFDIFGDIVHFIAEDKAEIRTFEASLSAGAHVTARPLTQGWSISKFSSLSGRAGIILLAGSSMRVSRRWALLDTSTTALTTIAEGSEEEQPLKLENSAIDSISWLGADEVWVQAWLIKPRSFDPTKKYPLLYCIHGGPNAAFNNIWPSGYWCNWNFILLAEQGYVVVAPNASGSTGCGQDFAQRVLGEWGGKPYVDHERGMAHIKTHIPYVDTTRAVALGISYGGFMVNWIQGQPLGRVFKALVSECGFANNLAQYTGDTIWFEPHFGGPMYNDKAGYEKYNPLNNVKHWSTPTLFISNELDYRVPVVEGIAAYQILQAKGVRSRLLSFPDEGHITTKPGNRLQWWHVVIDWCNTNTREAV